MLITVGIICYNNAYNVYKTLDDILIPTMSHYKHRQRWNLDLMVIDNSPEPLNIKLPDKLPAFFYSYKWNQGKNLDYAGGIAQLAQLAHHPFLLFICPNHCSMKNVTWLEDMMEPFNDPKVGMVGKFEASNLERIGLPESRYLYIQGGMIAARTDAMRSIPENTLYPHDNSDVWISYHMQQLGYELKNVDSLVNIVHGQSCSNATYKLKHYTN